MAYKNQECSFINKVFKHDMNLLWGNEKIQNVHFGLLATDTQDRQKLLSIIQNAEKQVVEIFS